MYQFYSHGKLLLTSEYTILDGVLGLALPTQKGQWLEVEETKDKGIFWQSFDEKDELWFESKLFEQTKDNNIQKTLEKILLTAEQLNPEFCLQDKSVKVTTRLEFARDWGLGSSSTLINNIAQWARVNPYELLQKSFGGSGYDIACARSPYAVLYQIEEDINNPCVYPLRFKPSFSEALFFVHLNQKQNSREGIQYYRKLKKGKKSLITQTSEITEEIVRATSLSDFSLLLDKHEDLLSNYLQMPTVKQKLFSDFQGTIKSLGAWGGDFVLAIGEKGYVEDYFSKKGFVTIVSFEEMIL